MDETLAVLRADARDANRARMWRYGVMHALTLVERALASGAVTEGLDRPATFPLDVDAFLAGIDSPNHSPESRRAWIALFFRDMQRAALASGAVTEGLDARLAEAIRRTYERGDLRPADIAAEYARLSGATERPTEPES